MLGASSMKHINEVGVNNDPKLIRKNLDQLMRAYSKAPYYDKVFPLMEKILTSEKENLAQYNAESFRLINKYLGITTKLIVSSTLEKDGTLKGQDKVLEICKLLGATEYYNAIGGQELYSFADFRRQGVKLSFLKTESITYDQFGGEFQPNLSIVDE